MLKKTRKQKVAPENQTMVEGEQEKFFSNDRKIEMESMWEIPQIFHFLHLTKDILQIRHLSMYEMERMLLIPRASRQLANIMTCLLSSQVTKGKLRKVPPMPYEFWTNVLAYKVKNWFKVFQGKHRDPIKVLETIGVEPEFWHIFPDASLVECKDFEEFTFKQRVWLLKTLCDTVMHARKTVQEEIAKQCWEDQFETILGTDRHGARYIYFPQFLKNDLRIYRHCLDNNILSTVKLVKPTLPSDTESKVKTEENKAGENVRSRKRRARWRYGLSTKTRKRLVNSNRSTSDVTECEGDSDALSLIHKRINLNCSNTNNNHISMKTMNSKRYRSLSESSEESIISTETTSTIHSSGYSTNISGDSKSVGENVPEKMFKGFSSSTEKPSNLAVISEILDNLKEEINKEKETNSSQVNLVLVSSENSEYINKVNAPNYRDSLYEHTDKSLDANSSASCDNSVERLNNSKTDDEKLHEIISAEKFNEKDGKQFCSDDAMQISTESKSDDEKLHETRAGGSNRKVKRNNNFSEETGSILSKTDELSQKPSEDSDNVMKNNIHNSGCSRDLYKSDSNVERIVTRQARRRSQWNNIDSNNSDNESDRETSKSDNCNSDNENDLSLCRLRSRLQKEANNAFSFYSDESNDAKGNLCEEKDINMENFRKEVRDFNEMLSELSVSKFQLVADSVEALRNLISTFSSGNSNSVGTDRGKSLPMCERKLVDRLTELLSSVEKMETNLKEATKRARAKLQKEWLNIKLGAVHCQLPETQRYKRYRNLPYPHLVPTTKTKVAQGTTSIKSPPANSKANAISEEPTTSKKVRKKVIANSVVVKLNKRKRNQNAKAPTKSNRIQEPNVKKSLDNRRREYYEPAESPRTQNSFTRTRRSVRTSWKNGPMLRQSTRLPAHRPIHPLLTLGRRPETEMLGQRRRTQTKIGFYRALANGKINVRLPVED